MTDFGQREEIVMFRITGSFGRQLEKAMKLIRRSNIELDFREIVDWLFNYSHPDSKEYKNELIESLTGFLSYAHGMSGKDVVIPSRFTLFDSPFDGSYSYLRKTEYFLSEEYTELFKSHPVFELFLLSFDIHDSLFLMDGFYSCVKKKGIISSFETLCPHLATENYPFIWSHFSFRNHSIEYLVRFVCFVEQVDKYKEFPKEMVEMAFSFLKFIRLCIPVTFKDGGKEAVLIKMPALYFNDRGQLHRDGAPAVEWGRAKFYYLNGVRAPEHIVMTPEEKLDPKIYFEERNVEIRRQIIWKLGMTRILSSLTDVTLIDKKSCYGIKDMYCLYEYYDPKAMEKRRFLRMKNPSLPINEKKHEYVEHCEFVHPDCETVEEAIIFRNGLGSFEIDEKEGLPYYQQGDVLIFPANTNKLKSIFPEVLT